MSKQVQLRRGTQAQHATFTGADGELTYDTTRKCLVLHDGATAGGRAMPAAVVLDPGDITVQQVILSRVKIVGGSQAAPGLVCQNAAKFEAPVTIGDLLTPVVDLAGSGTITIYFAFGRLHVLAALSGDVTFVAQDMCASRTACVCIPCGSTGRNLAFPAGWRFVGGAAPASIAANKTGWLELWCLGENETDVTARYSVQA
jgi:hypothetical protein